MAILVCDLGDRVRVECWFGTGVTELANAARAGATSIDVLDVTGYANTDTLLINPGGKRAERRVVSGTPSGITLVLTAGLSFAHAAGEGVLELAAPTTVTLTVVDPAGTSTDYTGVGLTTDVTGHYYLDLDIDLEGIWSYRWVGTGAVVAATPDGTISARATFA